MRAKFIHDVVMGGLAAANVFMAFDAFATHPNVVALNLAVAAWIAILAVNAE